MSALRVHKRGEFLALIEAAETVAKFSNLKPNEVDHFRHVYSDFVPQSWWKYQPILGRFDDEYRRKTGEPREYQWQLNQQFLQAAWEEKFDRRQFVSIARLLLSVFDPEQQMRRAEIAKAYTPEDLERERPVFGDMLDWLQPLYPYQKAVLFLFEHPWRAKFCLQCHKRFIAVERNSKYCSEPCSHLAHTRQKLESWNQAGGGRDQRAARMSKPSGAKIRKTLRGKRFRPSQHRRG